MKFGNLMFIMIMNISVHQLSIRNCIKEYGQKHLMNCLYMYINQASYQKLTLIFLMQNICCGYSKEPPQRDNSFEQPKLNVKTDV